MPDFASSRTEMHTRRSCSASEKLTANQCPRGRFDVTRSASSALATNGEAYSEVTQASGTTRPIQLNHIGTVQPPITAGHPKKIRSTWNSATTLKITLAIIVKVFWLIVHCPRRYSTQLGNPTRALP